MAVPKKKPSKHRTRTRRSAWLKSKKLLPVQPCDHCGELKRPHRVCPSCGYYHGEQVVQVETDEEEKEKGEKGEKGKS